MKWEMIRADKFCCAVKDGTHDTPKPVSEGYKLVTSKHIVDGHICSDDAYYISESDYNKINERSLVEKWDVLMSMIGNGLGKTAIIDKTPDYAIKNIALFKVGDEIKARWLHYYLSSKFGQGLIYSKLQGSGQPFISLGFIRGFDVPNPDYPTMMSIVSVLSAYDSQIENNQKRIKLLEQMAENLYKEWFVRFRFPGYETAEFEGGVPKGWKYEPIKKLGQIVGGGTPSTSVPEYWDGDIPWLSPVDLSNNQRVFVKQGKSSITELGMKKSSTKLLPANTVLLSSRAPVGYVALAANPICTNQGFKSVICDETCLLPYYLYFFFKQNTEVLKSFASGATFPELSGSTLGRIKILVPPIDIQKDFTSLLKSVLSQMEYLYDQIDVLTTQRDLLLPRLMSGKLSI